MVSLIKFYFPLTFEQTLLLQFNSLCRLHLEIYNFETASNYLMTI